jgi:cell fate regulator YaaT (PSP1 superfamily)
MARLHLVRVGTLGHVGRFTSAEALRYPRRARVVLRTRRGLEVGEVLSPPDDAEEAAEPDGTILRGMTIEDQLLEARLEKNRQQALEACTARLAERGWGAVLMDVEPLFDGRSLLFYFLGEVPGEVEALVAELAEVYDAKAQLGSFAELLTSGCGPGCGTTDAAGGGCQSCATGCAISGACGTRK